MSVMRFYNYREATFLLKKFLNLDLVIEGNLSTQITRQPQFFGPNRKLLIVEFFFDFYSPC